MAINDRRLLPIPVACHVELSVFFECLIAFLRTPVIQLDGARHKAGRKMPSNLR
jgi:hypothetical protein